MSTVREVLKARAKANLDVARKAASDLVEQLGHDDVDESEVDGLMLDLKWALGERRGQLTSIEDLEDAGLVPPEGGGPS